jgi:hypothetical protein
MSALKPYRDPAAALELSRQFGVAGLSMLVLWAIAAGSWRALDTAAGPSALAKVVDPPWAAALLGAPFFVVGAFGAVSLILLAAALVGGGFGFLFGLPRMQQRSGAVGDRAGPNPESRTITDAAEGGGNGPASAQTDAPATLGASGKPGQSAASTPATSDGGDRPREATMQQDVGRGTTAVLPDSRGTGFSPSPALTEIADWLTKIIVGVGLVQARDIGIGFNDVMKWFLNQGGLSTFPASGVVVPACMIIGLISGFLIVYLAMTLTIGPELAVAADDLERARERKLIEMAAQAEERATEAERKANEEKEKRIKEEQSSAARLKDRAQVIEDWRRRDLDVLLRADMGGPSPPEVSIEARKFADTDLREMTTLDERRAWAKINAALGRPEKALEAYALLLEEEVNG